MTAIATMAPAGLSTLPNELLYKICKNLCPHCANLPRSLPEDGYKLEDGRHALSCLSKTCRQLREIAQPILYHHVYTIRHWHFLRSIIARPDLAANVRELQYPGDSDSPFSGDLNADAVLRAQEELLKHMEGIDGTDINTINWADILDMILERLPNAEELSINIGNTHIEVFHADLESIRRLRLYSRSKDREHGDQMGSLLSVMPDLEELNISIDFRPEETYMLPFTELRSLDLEFSRWSASGLTTMINHCPQLERFRCYGVLGPGVYEDDLVWSLAQRILQPLKKTLKHVNFCRDTDFYPEEPSLSHYFGSFRELDGLETLWMDIGYILPDRSSPYDLTCPANTDELVALLPESLRLVYFCGIDDWWHGIEMLAQAIEGGHFPRLETVVVEQDGATLEESRRALAAVGVACESITCGTGDGRHLFPEGGFWDDCYWN